MQLMFMPSIMKAPKPRYGKMANESLHVQQYTCVIVAVASVFQEFRGTSRKLFVERVGLVWFMVFFARFFKVNFHKLWCDVSAAKCVRAKKCLRQGPWTP